MSYTTPIFQTYDLGSINFVSGAGAVARFQGPSGRKGRIDHAEIAGTTLFTAVTTPGFVQVGDGSDADKYLNFDAATTAANTVRTLDDDTDAVNTLIDADTEAVVTIVAPTGGTPAGVGNVRLVVAWI